MLKRSIPWIKPSIPWTTLSSRMLFPQTVASPLTLLSLKLLKAPKPGNQGKVNQEKDSPGRENPDKGNLGKGKDNPGRAKDNLL